MNNYLKFLLILAAGEIAASIIFYFVRKFFEVKSADKKRAFVGGVIERTVLFFGLAIDVSQVIIMFGTLKIGTMFSATKGDKKTNEYFLTGNLISVLLVLLYYFAYTKF